MKQQIAHCFNKNKRKSKTNPNLAALFFLKNEAIKFGLKSVPPYFCTPEKKGVPFDSVAQLVEQYTFNVWALGPSPSGITKKPSDTIWWLFCTVSCPLHKEYYSKKRTAFYSSPFSIRIHS